MSEAGASATWGSALVSARRSAAGRPDPPSIRGESEESINNGSYGQHMPSSAALLAFFLGTLVFLVVPGPGMLFILAGRSRWARALPW